MPAHTASRCNGLPPEQNETLLRLFVVPALAPLFGPSAKQGPAEATPENFDPETVLDPRDRTDSPFGPDQNSGEENGSDRSDSEKDSA